MVQLSKIVVPGRERDQPKADRPIDIDTVENIAHSTGENTAERIVS